MRRNKKASRPEKRRLPDKGLFPGSGADPDSRFLFDRQEFPSPRSDLSEVPAQKIREEIAFQERQLTSLQRTFRPVPMSTAVDSSDVKHQASNKMADLHQLIKLLRLELATRAETVDDPSVLSESDTVTEEVEHTVTKTDPEIVKRRTIVRQNQDTTAQEMCELFDRLNVLMPSSWRDKLFVKSWAQAYLKKELRGRIQAMISKDRHP